VHPLDPLTVAEIASAAAIARGAESWGARTRFISIALDEPAKDALPSYESNGGVGREAFLVAFDPDRGETYEAVVSLTAGKLSSWGHVPGVQPPITAEEFAECERAVKRDERYRAALARRGIDPELVLIEAWSIGDFGPPHTDGRRLAWAPAWARATPGANPYARPIEGLAAVVDLARMEIVELEDRETPPLPAGDGDGDYTPNAVGRLREDLRPLDVVQAEGPSFEVDGWEVRWQKWRFRIGFTPREGLVLHTVGYEDGGRVRPILHRASYAELVIPYGDPSPGQYRRNAFDIGEYGLGELVNSLELGCDCLGEVRYFDVALADSSGAPKTIANAICLHEEDFGLLWKHYDWQLEHAEVRRSRRLVVSSIATVGNYEYAFYWYLYQDGSIEAEVKLTGIVITGALAPGERPGFGTEVATGLYAPNHQHFFGVRLDFDVDGERNAVYEVHTEGLPPGPENPHGNAFRATATPLRREAEAQQVVDPLSGRYWKVVNHESRNSLGEPVAYKLVPGDNVLPFAHEDASVVRRAGFMTKHLWVTPFDPAERYPAGDYPNQHPGGAGLPEWTLANRSIEDTDVVVWYTMGNHHVPRPEDWPVMPVQRIGFRLEPFGFFNRNPALDVPPPPEHCRSDP
jgi:primary-amine oxidase